MFCRTLKTTEGANDRTWEGKECCSIWDRSVRTGNRGVRYQGAATLNGSYWTTGRSS